MNNIKFKKIENIKEYIEKALQSGEMQEGMYQKYGDITARVGCAGEEIVTILATGLEETRNIVSLDENNNPGWVVTNSTGEQYIVTDEVFKSKYEKIVGTEDGFRPVWNPITAVQINENICFKAPWGEKMNIVAGGYLVFNEGFEDIYGIQKEAFNLTYKKVYC